MAAPMPTRITIEVHPPQAPGEAWTARTAADGATVHVGARPGAVATLAPVAGEPREGPSLTAPAAYEPGECTCLDEAECGHDHANE